MELERWDEDGKGEEVDEDEEEEDERRLPPFLPKLTT